MKRKPRSKTESGAGYLTVLDAQAVIAGLTDEPARSEVEALLRSVDDPPSISGVNLAEVVDVLVRTNGFSYVAIHGRLALLISARLEVVAVDETIGRQAGDLRARHYDRVNRAVSIADCVALATAISVAGRLATSDQALADMARAEGVKVVGLPDRSGRRPS